jgi:hypothetical protein
MVATGIAGGALALLLASAQAFVPMSTPFMTKATTEVSVVQLMQRFYHFISKVTMSNPN